MFCFSVNWYSHTITHRGVDSEHKVRPANASSIILKHQNSYRLRIREALAVIHSSGILHIQKRLLISLNIYIIQEHIQKRLDQQAQL